MNITYCEYCTPNELVEYLSFQKNDELKSYMFSFIDTDTNEIVTIFEERITYVYSESYSPIDYCPRCGRLMK